MKSKTTPPACFTNAMKTMKNQTPPPQILLPPATGPGRAWPAQIILILAAAAMLVFAQLAGATSYTWNVTSGNWSTPASWTPATGTGGPLATDTVVFGIKNNSSSASTVNNVVDAGFAGTISSLTYNSTNPAGYNVTQIGLGQTLTVTNTLSVGLQNGVMLISQAYLTGGGTLVATVTNFTVQSYGSASGANSSGNLNLAGLSTFIFNNTNTTMSIADVNSFTRAGGNLTLASQSNNISAATINVATSASAQAGPLSTLTLGAGTNIINAKAINLANNKGSATLSFAAPGGGLRVRGASGADTDRATITIGNRNQTGTGTCLGTAALSGGRVDIKAGTLTLGANPNTGTPGAAGTFGNGVLQFDNGIVDATTILMGASATVNLGSANGTLTVGTNGTLIVGTGGLSLLNQGYAEGASWYCSGTLNISNGTVLCNGSITVTTNAGGTGNSTINFINGGLLNLASGACVGSLAQPVNNFNLIENAILQFGLPSAVQTNIVVNTLTWPNNDSLLTINIGALPANTAFGTVFPLIQFNSMSGGAFTAPNLILPPGVTGTLTIAPSGNLIVLTITGGVGPGTGGINQLVSPGFELAPGGAGWTAAGNASLVTTGAVAYLHSGACADGQTKLVVSHSGTNVAKLAGANLATGSTNFWSQTVATVPGSTFSSGAFTYVSHEDLMSGKNSFYYQVDFLGSNQVLLASFQSYIVTNLVCGETTPFPLDAWVFLPVTNQLQVTGGVSTGVVVSNVPSGILTAPPQTASVRFGAVFLQQGLPDNADSGSVYFDDANLGLTGGPLPGTNLVATPNLIAFCTNTALSCSVTSTVTTISSVQVIVKSTTLGGITTNTVTNTVGSPFLTVTGLGTPSASLSYALTTNLLYPSIIVRWTDANGVTVSTTNMLDTLVPTLVVEAADYNFSNGQFLDTPPDGGLALYAGQTGGSTVDYNKGTRTATSSYYRPSDPVIIQAAAPGSGTPPTSTEQKFINAAADGDTTDVELEVGYNSVGDWLNYSRTFGPGGSAPAGTYNVWCYLATSGTGVQATFSQVTSDPTQGSQTTTVLGNFGTAAFTDNGYNNFRYVPLVDQFGNILSLTISNGVQTFKSTVVGNPNLGFYLFVPVAPIYTPVFPYVSPNGLVPFESTGEFTFTVGPAQGAPITTNGISLSLNGEPVTSGLTFTKLLNGEWTVSCAIQSNTVYNAVISVTNTAGEASTITPSFDTFSQSNYMWEAEDYDFQGGQFIDNPVPSYDPTAGGGLMETNSYAIVPGDNFANTAIVGVDDNYAFVSGETEVYRPLDTVGTAVATDFIRQKFYDATNFFQDVNITDVYLGWWNAGFWVNYTRTFPTNNFYIYGRLAGGAGAFSGTTLAVVTSGAGTTTQTTNIQGSFADPNAAGWQAWHWVPLLDANGHMAVVPLGGVETLQLKSGGNLNANYYMLVPAPLTGVPLTVSLNGGQPEISFPTAPGHDYTLQYKNNLTDATWSTLNSIAGNGDTESLTDTTTTGVAQRFYRVEIQ
jgi:hypothetical protein